jgi:hypothetical protein
MVYKHIGHFTNHPGYQYNSFTGLFKFLYTVKHLVMKKQLMVSLIAGLLLQVSTFAQSKGSPEGVSEKGWWVIETNIHTPKKNIVYFYNNDGVLVYKEKIEGIRINPSRKTTRMQLKQVLESAVVTWEQKHKLQEDQELVANSLRKK